MYKRIEDEHVPENAAAEDDCKAACKCTCTAVETDKNDAETESVMNTNDTAESRPTVGG